MFYNICMLHLCSVNACVYIVRYLHIYTSAVCAHVFAKNIYGRSIEKSDSQSTRCLLCIFPPLAVSQHKHIHEAVR